MKYNFKTVVDTVVCCADPAPPFWPETLVSLAAGGLRPESSQLTLDHVIILWVKAATLSMVIFPSQGLPTSNDWSLSPIWGQLFRAIPVPETFPWYKKADTKAGSTTNWLEIRTHHRWLGEHRLKPCTL